MDFDCLNLLFQVLFQHTVRHSPLRIDDLLASITSSSDQEKDGKKPRDVEMTD